jgi:hypothetical protein
VVQDGHRGDDVVRGLGRQVEQVRPARAGPGRHRRVAVDALDVRETAEECGE